MLPINTYVDYTLLQPDVSEEKVASWCEDAIRYDFFAVCVLPQHLPFAAQKLKNQSVRACSVVGYPPIHLSPREKHKVARSMIKAGAEELDLVMDTENMKSGTWNHAEAEIRDFQALCEDHNVVSKLIVESSFLSQPELRRLCAVCERSYLDFVQCTSGYDGLHADLRRIRFLREILSPETKIKAFRGSANYDVAASFIEAGAERIGTSSVILPLENQ